MRLLILTLLLCIGCSPSPRTDQDVLNDAMDACMELQARGYDLIEFKASNIQARDTNTAIAIGVYRFQ